MANETPESEFSIECFQNYSAGEVFVQGLAGVVDQTDVESLIRAQKIMTKSHHWIIEDAGPECACCRNLLQEPYIECSDCDANVCTACYSTGRETGNHSSDHSYRIRKNDFSIFHNCNWTAKEEMKLLSALATHGYGNWEEISKNIQTRSDVECEEHYKKYYIDNVQNEELNLLPHTTQSMFPRPLVPFLQGDQSCVYDPPRCETYCNRNLAGYNPYRGDFTLNYDHNAENILNIVTEVDYEDDLMKSLTIAIGYALNTRLRERKRRYDIIKRHGLILPHKITAWAQRFDATLGRAFTEKMFPFMHFFTGIQFDVFMERLNLEAELSQKIARLYEYRRNGIKSLFGARVYKKLKKSDSQHMKDLKNMKDTMDKSLSKLTPEYCEIIAPNGKTRMKSLPKPLEIEDLPGYHSLSNSEKDLCCNIRLLPKKYLKIKEQLITENSKLGFLRLLDARKVVRIDVNKTRKVYDYLVKEGYIKKPS